MKKSQCKLFDNLGIEDPMKSSHYKKQAQAALSKPSNEQLTSASNPVAPSVASGRLGVLEAFLEADTLVAV